MAYDQGLAERCEDILQGTPGLIDKKMFGGIGYLLHGNMACGVLNDNLIVRVGPDAYADAMSHDHTLPFDITGRSMNGWVMVTPDGTSEDIELKSWIESGLLFAETLTPK